MKINCFIPKVKTEPMMQKDSNVKEPFNPVTEPNANMVISINQKFVYAIYLKFVSHR